jgi:TRAP-type C4-dicarboxylate transport system permease large subunit
LYEAIKGSVNDLGMVMLLIMMAAVLGYAVTLEQGPQQIAALVTQLTENPLMILILVLLLLLVGGMFIEGAANILLVTPIVLPVLTGAGFDPIHMGILIVTLINIGGLTPPVGVIMFTVCGILEVKTGEFTKAAAPYFIGLLVFLAFLIAFPALSLFLPNRIM